MKKIAKFLLPILLVALLLLPFEVLANRTTDIGVAATDGGSGVPTQLFEDVPTSAWYFAAIQSAVQKGLMAGVSDKHFSPNSKMTRAMLATVLYCLDGAQKTDKTMVRFTDVTTSAWYYAAAEWAALNKIDIGFTDSVFGANSFVTRQQMAKAFQSYAKYKGRNIDSTADLTVYKDTSDVADWAQSAMNWAVSGGLITGTNGSFLLPNSPTTRAEAASMLINYINGAALENRTSDYISQFIKGNFNNFYKDYNEELKKSFTSDLLVSSWISVIQKSGPIKKYLGSTYTKQNGYNIVDSSFDAMLYNFKIIISYDKNGKPDGLHTRFSPKEPPEPKSSDKWEEVAVKVGDKELPGMLTLPKGVQKPPVLIMIQGSGPSDMNESLGTTPNRPFEDIAHGLADQGVATLRYNKSTYQYPNGGGDTIQDEILDDAAAAVKLLCNEKRVDENRIYVLGHSLGGIMAPKITTDNSQIKGFISLAGSLRTLQDIMLDQNITAVMAATSLTEQQKSDLILQVKSEINKTKTLEDGGTGFILGATTNYWKSLNAIDNLTLIKNLNVPMLIMQGSSDFQVYADKDYKLWQDTLQGRNNVTFKLYNGLSHLFMTNQISPNGVADASLYNAPNHVDPQVIADIATWINNR